MTEKALHLQPRQQQLFLFVTEGPEVEVTKGAHLAGSDPS